MMLLLLACAYEPPLAPSADYPESSSLSGEVVLVGGVPDTDVRIGHVLLYDVENPPPPEAFGAPMDFSTIGTDGWSYSTSVVDTGGSTVNATASGEWSITGVPDGDWLLTALVDNDGDFNPFPGISDFAGGATCGDQVGAYLFNAGGAPAPVRTVAPSYQDGLDLLVGPPIPFERPAFELWTADSAANGYAPLVQSNLITIDPSVSPLVKFQFINLVSHPVAHPLLTLNPTASASCPTTFTVVRRDADGDGLVDPHPSALGGAGYEDVYPVVIIALVADADGNPIPDDANTIISPLPIRPTYDTSVPVETPFTTTELQLLFTGVFYELVDGERVELEEPVEGTWGLAVLNENGQMWQVPNGLSDPDTWPEFADWIDPTQGAMVVTAVGGG